jgi:hypothetical protein
MTVLLLVTLLATASLPQGPPRPAAPVSGPAVAPDTLGALDAFGSLGSPGASGKDLFSGFS